MQSSLIVILPTQPRLARKIVIILKRKLITNENQPLIQLTYHSIQLQINVSVLLIHYCAWHMYQVLEM